MAQEGFDKLIAMTDSRYRLSMVVARRAAQLKMGIPSLLSKDEEPKTRNTVTVAMKELTSDKAIIWGRKDIPSPDDLRKMFERERKEQKEKEAENYSIIVR
ncbi:MAG: DNA-directed RNA polymerase subunit omega [Deinococcales bacterium]